MRIAHERVAPLDEDDVPGHLLDRLDVGGEADPGTAEVEVVEVGPVVDHDSIRAGVELRHGQARGVAQADREVRPDGREQVFGLRDGRRRERDERAHGGGEQTATAHARSTGEGSERIGASGPELRAEALRQGLRDALAKPGGVLVGERSLR